MLIELGAHNVVSVAVNTGTGTGLVVTVIDPGDDVQPAADVAVTVYVVLPAGGVTDILAVVAHCHILSFFHLHLNYCLILFSY